MSNSSTINSIKINSFYSSLFDSSTTGLCSICGKETSKIEPFVEKFICSYDCELAYYDELVLERYNRDKFKYYESIDAYYRVIV